jgi:L-histidine Nalpha-methyltransferase / hercynylcysteine S-oxide synthase
VCLLLRALDDAGKEIEYYALDLSRTELERTLAQVPPLKHVSCHGLLGTYDDGRQWLKQPSILSRSKCILHLGSSIGKILTRGWFDTQLTPFTGNFDRDEAAEFLKSFADVLRPSDRMLLGVDACCDPAKV